MSIPPGAPFVPCMVTDLSEGGVGLHCIGKPWPAEMVGILRIAGFGDFEGITMRGAGTALGFRFLIGEAERHHVAAKLATYVQEGLTATLGQEQWPSQVQLSFVRPTGETQKCDVLDISLRRVSLKTSARPPAGEVLKLGHMYGRVSHHHDAGIEVRFIHFVNDGRDTPLAG